MLMAPHGSLHDRENSRKAMTRELPPTYHMFIAAAKDVNMNSSSVN